ncbi:transposase [Schaalia georgiae]|uniref:transposase n=1 Tax=Schaalia georgiae TaxID=52768 RepID=UPI003C734AC2
MAAHSPRRQGASPSSWTSRPPKTAVVPRVCWTWSRTDSEQVFKDLARHPPPSLARRNRDRRDGRIHRIQERGRVTDPLYKARRVLHTRSSLLTPRQQHQVLDLFASDEHVAVEVTWSVYQNIIDAYSQSDRRAGKALMQTEITTLTSSRVPTPSPRSSGWEERSNAEPATSWPTSSPPHTSNGPTEAIKRPPRTPTRLRPRIAQPHPLRHPSTTRNRRIQTPTTPQTMKSDYSLQLSANIRRSQRYNAERALNN